MTHEEILSPDIKKTLTNVATGRVEEIIKELDQYGLAVAMPHFHFEDKKVGPLPEDKIHYENDLKVSFLNKKSFRRDLENGFAVMWRFNEKVGKPEACAWCHW